MLGGIFQFIFVTIFLDAQINSVSTNGTPSNRLLCLSTYSQICVLAFSRDKRSQIYLGHFFPRSSNTRFSEEHWFLSEGKGNGMQRAQSEG